MYTIYMDTLCMRLCLWIINLANFMFEMLHNLRQSLWCILIVEVSFIIEPFSAESTLRTRTECIFSCYDILLYIPHTMHIWCCLFGRSVLGAFRAYIVLVVKKGSGFSGPVWMYVCVWYNKYRKWSADGAHDFIHKQVRGGFADCRDSWGFFPFMNGAQWGR